MRALGVDLGTKRIGLAISTSNGSLATPYDMVERTGNRREEHAAIARLATEAEVEIIVVGLPLHLDGRVSPRAKKALREAQQLEVATGLPVETYDERLSTVSADHSLNTMGVSGKKRRTKVDAIAASVFLQSWLDARKNESEQWTNND